MQNRTHTIGSAERRARPGRRLGRAHRGVLAGLPGSVREALQLVLTWRRRVAQRDALSKLDGRLLKDIGVSHAEAAREARKPFWRP